MLSTETNFWNLHHIITNHVIRSYIVVHCICSEIFTLWGKNYQRQRNPNFGEIILYKCTLFREILAAKHITISKTSHFGHRVNHNYEVFMRKFERQVLVTLASANFVKNISFFEFGIVQNEYILHNLEP